MGFDAEACGARIRELRKGNYFPHRQMACVLRGVVDK